MTFYTSVISLLCLYNQKSKLPLYKFSSPSVNYKLHHLLSTYQSEKYMQKKITPQKHTQTATFQSHEIKTEKALSR